jgi:hypothetical protein
MMSNLENIRVQKYPHTLLEKYNIFWLEPEICIGLKKSLVATSGPTGHDVPRHNDRTDGLAGLLLCDLLQTRDAFHLVPE